MSRTVPLSIVLLALVPGAEVSAARGSIAESEALLDGRPWQLGTLVRPGRLRCVLFDVDDGLEHCILATPELGRTVKLGRYLEAGGLRLGDGLVLRGGLDGGMGYDSNQLQENVEDGERGSGVLRALGHGTLTIAGRAPVGARLRLVAGYREHFAGEPPTGSLGGLDLDGDLLIRAVAGPVLRLELGETLTRSAAVPLTGARYRSAVLEHTTAARARLLLGDLALHFEYQLMLRRAEERASSYRDRRADRGSVSLRWHGPLWVVRTLSINLSQQWLRHPDGAPAEDESRPFRGTLGLLARTSWFYAAAELGYGASYVAGGDDYRGAVASMEVGGLLPGRVRAWLGFHHDFEESELLDYVVQDVVFGGADFVVADGLLVVHQTFATRRRRPRGRRPWWLVGRDLDHYLTNLGFGAQLRLFPWLSLGLDYDLQLRMAPFERGAGSWSYVDHRVMLSAGLGT